MRLAITTSWLVRVICARFLELKCLVSLLWQGHCYTNVAHVMASPGGSATLMLMDHKNLNKPAKSIAACMFTVLNWFSLHTKNWSDCDTSQAVGRKKMANGNPQQWLYMPQRCRATIMKLSFNFLVTNWYVTALVPTCSRQTCGLNVRILHYSCAKSNKDGFFGKSDPFYIISKRREGTSNWVPCFTSGPWLVWQIIEACAIVLTHFVSPTLVRSVLGDDACKIDYPAKQIICTGRVLQNILTIIWTQFGFLASWSSAHLALIRRTGQQMISDSRRAATSCTSLSLLTCLRTK